MGKVNLVIVLTINPAEKESLTHYLTNLSILYEEVGAKRIAKYDISETLIGDKSQTPTRQKSNTYFFCNYGVPKH